MEIALLPCPFCDGAAELEEVDGGGWSVGCAEKQLSVHYCMGYQSLTSFATKREAVAAWNTRRPPYTGPPCSTCGAAHPFDNVFCSNGFHAPPDDAEWLRQFALGEPNVGGRERLERIAKRLTGEG